MQLCYSTARFARAYPTERQEAFFDGMQEGFYYFEGVPQKVTFDNPKTLVKKLYRGHRRDEQKNFTIFRSHFMFEGHFCNTQCPNEKGHVEGLVGVIRRNVFVPIPQVESIEELNEPILNWCQKDLDRSHSDEEGTVKDHLDKEKEKLLSLPKRRYPCCRTREAIVNKFSEVRFDHNLYSVPIKYAHRCVTIKGYVDKVKIIKDEVIIAEALSRAITFGSFSVDAVRILLNHKEDNPLEVRLDTKAWPEFDAIKVKAPDIEGFNRLLEIEEVSIG